MLVVSDEMPRKVIILFSAQSDIKIELSNLIMGCRLFCSENGTIPTIGDIHINININIINSNLLNLNVSSTKEKSSFILGLATQVAQLLLYIILCVLMARIARIAKMLNNEDVVTLGRKLVFLMEKRNSHNVSLGQGQDIVAQNALEAAPPQGRWAIFRNNICIWLKWVKKWLPSPKKKLKQNWEKPSDESDDAESHIIPQCIHESSIKLTSEPEPSTGILVLANLHKGLDNFTQESMEVGSKELKFKAALFRLFSLGYFHAVVAERRKFVTQEWNRSYPFNTGDLTIRLNVLFNYLEANTKVPWEDLCYLFGEIMYRDNGGHTDDWDRRLCKTYLKEFMQQELLDVEINYAPGFRALPTTDYQGYHHQDVDEMLPAESPPVLYGLHQNAEIGFLTATATSETLFQTIVELQSRESGAGGIKQILDDIFDKLQEAFSMSEINGSAEEKTLYVIVVLQECERMITLTIEIRRPLKEFDLGLKGELIITNDMEGIENALFLGSNATFLDTKSLSKYIWTWFMVRRLITKLKGIGIAIMVNRFFPSTICLALRRL